jgi:large subunit ribosomal protein L25
MKQIPLAAKIRTDRGSSRSRRMRAKGFIPAELYGHKEQNQSIEIPAKEFSVLLASARGENIFFNINIEGGQGGPVLAVIKEIQYHKVNESILHADFHKIKMNEKIRIRVPIRILNADICEGVKVGGVLQTFMRSLDVQCLPSQIPDAIMVDALHMGVGHSVHVSEIMLPEGVKAFQSGDMVVISVAAQMAEEVKAEVAAAVPAEGAEGVAGEPEVITAKKKEEGAEEGKTDAKAPAGKAEAKPAEKKPADKK